MELLASVSASLHVCYLELSVVYYWGIQFILVIMEEMSVR